MRYLLNHIQMKSCDTSTIERFKVPSEVLMERAALAVRDAAVEHFHPRKVLVLCGSGNNGGDGFAAARLLLIAGIKADVLFLGKHAHMTDQCRLEEMIFTNYGGVTLPDDADIHGYDLIIDALFGIGLSREILGRYADVINAVNRADTPVLSIDIPSGISADDGQIQGAAIKADVTVTFQYEKLGQKLFPGEDYCGKLIVADVGINPISASAFPTLSDFSAFSDSSAAEPVYTLEESDLSSLLPARHRDDNKGTHGKLLIAAGGSGMAGAAILAAKAAFRSGAGMVCVLTHPDNRLAIQTAVPEAIFAPWPDLENQSAQASLLSATAGSAPVGSACPGSASVGSVSKPAVHAQSAPTLSAEGLAVIDRWLSWCDALAVGPGLGTGGRSLALLTYLLRNYAGPVVIDADALNLMSRTPGLAPISSIPAIITPHPGEMKRLLSAGGLNEDLTVADIAARPIQVAASYSIRTGLITVLKGARTVVTDGSETMLNTLGNEGMATAGSGDSLTGIIGSLLAQRLAPIDAARAGVLLHALAGDKAAETLGTRSLRAGDLSEYMPQVLRSVSF